MPVHNDLERRRQIRREQEKWSFKGIIVSLAFGLAALAVSTTVLIAPWWEPINYYGFSTESATGVLVVVASYVGAILALLFGGGLTIAALEELRLFVEEVLPTCRLPSPVVWGNAAIPAVPVFLIGVIYLAGATPLGDLLSAVVIQAVLPPALFTLIVALFLALSLRGGGRVLACAVWLTTVAALFVGLWNLPALLQVPVPNVLYGTRYEAEHALRASGFEPEVETREVSEENVGEVVSQYPFPGSKEDDGSTVTITVGEPTMIDVPDLFGTTQDEAERYAGEDFRIEEGASKVSDEPKGTIVGQDTMPGSRVQQGETISLVTSAGQPPYPGDILFEDFSDALGGWLEAAVEYGIYHHTDGQYQLYVPASSSGALAWSNTRFLGDAVLEVDVTTIGDIMEDSAFGITCFGQDADGDHHHDNYYEMRIWADGSSQIRKVEDNETTVLDEGYPNGAVRASPQTNHLRADCGPSELALYSNGQELVDAYDSEYRYGKAGLSVHRSGATEDPGANVHFDNYRISTPP